MESSIDCIDQTALPSSHNLSSSKSARMPLPGSFWPLTPPPAQRPPPSRPPKPTIHQTYSRPLPLTTYPLPPLIPNNPLSLLHLAYVFFRYYFNSSSSQPEPKLRGYYSENTRSIHVTDPASIRYLWEAGFFGKGSLSRSEPTWLERESKKKERKSAEASENLTAARREERRRFKLERARKEQEAIDEKLMEELLVDSIASAHASGVGKPTLRSKYEGLAEVKLTSPVKHAFTKADVEARPLVPSKSNNKTQREIAKAEPLVGQNGTTIIPKSVTKDTDENRPIEDKEHLQLTCEEAFFLSFALGVIEICSENAYPHVGSGYSRNREGLLSNSQLLALFTSQSRFPPSPSPLYFDTASPFLLHYVTYHHFRSLGWAVRPGLKFGVDWLLYLRGPVFAHAEFAVVIKSAFTDPFWHGRTPVCQDLSSHEDIGDMSRLENDTHSSSDRPGNEPAKDWHWLHSIQRVQAQVRKTLIIAWVDIPPPSAIQFSSKPRLEASSKEELLPVSDQTKEEIDIDVDIKTLLQQYKIREMVFRRWIPNRSRD